MKLYLNKELISIRNDIIPSNITGAYSSYWLHACTFLGKQQRRDSS